MSKIFVGSVASLLDDDVGAVDDEVRIFTDDEETLDEDILLLDPIAALQDDVLRGTAGRSGSYRCAPG